VSLTTRWQMPGKMANALRGAISNRKIVQSWYQRLPSEDKRRNEDDSHQNMIKILEDGADLLESTKVLPSEESLKAIKW